jgi:hypothetical protein
MRSTMTQPPPPLQAKSVSGQVDSVQAITRSLR